MAEFTRADVERIVDERLFARSKAVERVATVSGLEPLTVTLDGGAEVHVTLVDPSLVLAVGERVAIEHAGTGYMITGRAGPPGAPTIPDRELPDSCIGRVVVIAVSVLDIPEGWALMDGGTYAGKLGPVTTPNWCDGRVLRAGQAGTVEFGTTGGTATHTHGSGSLSTNNAGQHDHGGNTSGPSNVTAKVNSSGTNVAANNHNHNIGNGGSHGHNVNSGDTGTGSSLPPWRAVPYIMWIGIAPEAI